MRITARQSGFGDRIVFWLSFPVDNISICNSSTSRKSCSLSLHSEVWKLPKLFIYIFKLSGRVPHHPMFHNYFKKFDNISLKFKRESTQLLLQWVGFQKVSFVTARWRYCCLFSAKKKYCPTRVAWKFRGSFGVP